MARKCYISFKTEDFYYKNYIQENLHLYIVDKSLNESINSLDDDYVMRVIRQEYLSDSTVTVHLIGQYGAENRGYHEQRFIKRELQASLYHGAGNTQNGILGIALPSIYHAIYGGSGICQNCGNSHNYVYVNDSTTIKEFSYNYYIPNNKCAWSEEDRFCILVKWDDFVLNPEIYIEQAFEKRFQEIADETKVRPL